VEPKSSAPKVPTLEAATALARNNRPLLRALSEQVTAAEKAIAVAWGPFLPSVSLNGRYSRNSPYPEPFFRPDRQNVVGGDIRLEWNIFNGFATSAEVQRARESLSLATLNRERAETDLQGDLRRSIEALSTQLEIVRVAEANLKLSEGALKLAEERFAAGAGSTLEVRDAQVKLTSAGLSEVQARFDVELARAGLRRVAGIEVEEK
jgi:outer membrane protein TolC